MGGGAHFYGYTATAKGRAASAIQFWGFPSIYACTPCCRTTKLDVVTQFFFFWGGGLCLAGQPSLHHRVGRVPALPNFGVLFYLYIHPLTTNCHLMSLLDVGRGLVFRWSTLPHPKRGGNRGIPALLNFGGSFLFMRTLFVAELRNLTW